MTTNPALDELQVLVGGWDMELSEASFLPDPARLGKCAAGPGQPG